MVEPTKLTKAASGNVIGTAPQHPEGTVFHPAVASPASTMMTVRHVISGALRVAIATPAAVHLCSKEARERENTHCLNFNAALRWWQTWNVVDMSSMFVGCPRPHPPWYRE